MAIDNTPPRLRLISTIAVIVIVTLVGLDFVFKSYFAYMTDQAVHEKLAPLKERDELHAAEKAAFAAAKTPLAQVMADLAKGTRDPLVTPQQSDDLSSMTGWTKLPKPAPKPVHGATAPEGAPEEAPAPTDAADAGAPEGAPTGPEGVPTQGAPAHDAHGPQGAAPQGAAPAPAGSAAAAPTTSAHVTDAAVPQQPVPQQQPAPQQH